jgi:hypothetical protein
MTRELIHFVLVLHPAPLRMIDCKSGLWLHGFISTIPYVLGTIKDTYYRWFTDSKTHVPSIYFSRPVYNWWAYNDILFPHHHNNFITNI